MINIHGKEINFTSYMTPIPHWHSVFAGGEVSVRIGQFNPYTISEFRITANIHNSQEFMELVMVVDALRRLGHNLPIRLVMPYFPYARQDRVCNPGEALGARVFADLINSLKFEQVTVWDPHSDVVGAVLNRCDIIHCEEFVRWIPGVKHMTLVAPDAGAAKKVKACAEVVGAEYVTAHKTRDPKTGEITGSDIDENVSFAGDVLIVDDICDGGRTFIQLAKKLRKCMGRKAKLYLYVTHGIFSYGLDPLIKGKITKVYCANIWDSNVPPNYYPTYIEKVRQL